MLSHPNTVWTPVKKGSMTKVSMTSKRMMRLGVLSVSVALRRVRLLESGAGRRAAAMARARVVQSVRLAMVRSMRSCSRTESARRWRVPLQSLRACKLSFPYACTVVVSLRRSELGEVLRLTNELEPPTIARSSRISL